MIHIQRDRIFAADLESSAVGPRVMAVGVGVKPGGVIQIAAGAENLSGILRELQLRVAIGG